MNMKTSKQKFYLFRKSRGIALLLVLATLALLSGVIVEFAYNSNVTYQLALNEKEQLQSYYLAQSAVGFGKMLIFYDNEAKKLIGDASQKAGKTIDIKPLYEMIPIDTAILRGLSGSETAPSDTGEAPSAEGEAAAPEEEKSTTQTLIAGLGVGGDKSFLDFEGDFSTEVTQEETKINLNAFFTLLPNQRPYQRLKNTLYHLLLTKDFEGMFTDRFQGAQELAQNIADYIDKDEAQNGPLGEERGREGADAGANVKMKNGKLLSVDELMMVPKMNELIFQKLKEFVTIYGADEKIIICRAKEPLVRALVIAYTENNSKMEPVRDDNQELLDKAEEAVLNSCPDLQAMASEVDKVLGVTENPSNPATPSAGGFLRGTTTQGQQPGAPTADQFSNLAKDDGKFYSIIGAGRVGEIAVKLKTIVDTSNSNPNQWPTLYWREE